MIDTKRLATDAGYWDEVAPDGATHYIDPTGTVYDDRDGGQFCEQVDSGAYWILPDRQCFWPDSTGVLCITRPQSQPEGVDGLPEWDGKTWPIPAGITVENWCGEKRTVVAHDRNNIICRCEESEGYRGYTPKEAENSSLRPIPTPTPTPEQRQREELGELVRKAYLDGASEHVGGLAAITEAILSRYNLEPKP